MEIFHGQECGDVGVFGECPTGFKFMDFILDNIVFILFGVGALVQWLKSTKEAKQEQTSQETQQREYESYEEFVEEVERSIPRAAVPPPLPAGGAGPMPGVERSPVPNLRKSGQRELSEAPPLSAMNSELERQAALAEQLRELKRAKKVSMPAFENRKKEKSETIGGIGLKARLRTRRELRDAFVLKEILEKPVGLR